MPRPRLLTLAVLVLGGIAWTAAWHFAARKVESFALGWIAQQREAGFAVRHRALYASGFPFRLNLEIEAPFFGGAAKATPVDWQGGWLTLEVKPWNLHSFTIRTPGWHRFEITDPRHARAFILDAGTLDIVLRLAAGGIESAMSELREAEIGPEGKPDRAWIAGLDLAFRFPPPPANPADLAPNLQLAAQRLRPEWVLQWLEDRASAVAREYPQPMRCWRLPGRPPLRSCRYRTFPESSKGASRWCTTGWSRWSPRPPAGCP